MDELLADSRFVGSRIPTVRGRPAEFWRRISYLVMPAMAVPLPAFLALMLAFPSPSRAPWITAITMTFLVLGSVGLIVGEIVSSHAISRGRSEREAGYTTMRWADFDLPQLGPGTTVVIRAAGVGPIPYGEYRAMTRWARAVESGAAAGSLPVQAAPPISEVQPLLNPPAFLGRIALVPLLLIVPLVLGGLKVVSPHVAFLLATGLGTVTLTIVVATGWRLIVPRH